MPATTTPTLMEEGYITVAAAARMMPVRRGKRVHPTTIVRWIRTGCRGVLLEGELLPSGYVTSAQAVARFARAFAAASAEPSRSGSGAEPATARRRAELDEARRQLRERLGVGET